MIYFRLLFLLILFAKGMTSLAQDSTAVTTIDFPQIDKSPVDILYYPIKSAIQGLKPSVKIIYSRPSVRNRKIFGQIVPYGNLWRTGANEATEIILYENVTIGNTNIPKGRYSLFTIPNEKEWVVILNKSVDIWGDFSYNELEDVLRINVSSSNSTQFREYLSMTFAEKLNSKEISLVIAWENTIISIPMMLSTSE